MSFKEFSEKHLGYKLHDYQLLMIEAFESKPKTRLICFPKKMGKTSMYKIYNDYKKDKELYELKENIKKLENLLSKNKFILNEISEVIGVGKKTSKD